MKKALRIIGLILVVGALVAAIALSTSSEPTNAEKVWDSEMTLGNMEAKNYFIVYSDLVCPYCVAFENAIVENEEEFKQYLADNDVLYEVRVSDFLYEYGESNPKNSRYSADAVYCAKREGKFWDYYNLAIKTVWNDFFAQSGKAAVAKMDSLDASYWIKIGEQIGLGDSFKKCTEDEEMLDEIMANAAKTAKSASGMPYFKFNSYTASGFSLDGDWEDVLMFFEAGLKTKK